MSSTDTINFNELRRIYQSYFSIGYLNPSSTKDHTSFERRLILISLICYLVKKNKAKNPDLTYYSLIYKLSSNLGLPDKFIKGLAIICEDFAYGVYEDFPTFGFSGKQILTEIQEILKSYIPF